MKKVLIVEHDEGAGLNYELAAFKAGFDALLTDNMHDALNFARKERFPLYLCGAHFSGIPGGDAEEGKVFDFYDCLTADIHRFPNVALVSSDLSVKARAGGVRNIRVFDNSPFSTEDLAHWLNQ